MRKTSSDITDYIKSRYGSVHAFKLLKYFLENKLARESGGFAVYELSFNIAPSEVLTKNALVKIECLTDDAEQKDAEAGLDLLVQQGILTIDSETYILELNVPIDSIANVYLKETDRGFEVVSGRSLADVILLPVGKRAIPLHQKDENQQTNIAAVPDMLYRDENGTFSRVEIKFGRSTGPNIRTLNVKERKG